MIFKRAYVASKEVQALNRPNLSGLDYIIIEHEIPIQSGIVDSTQCQIKTASKLADKAIGGDAGDFDLEAAIREHPDSLFVKVFAIKAEESNDNGDYFSKLELKKAVASFIGVPVFTNHENSDVNKARGSVVHSWWDEDKNGIMIIARVDAAAYPQLARGIREEYIINTSMGCQVEGSVCSICHNWATNADQYCSHIKNQKTRNISVRSTKCKYHEHGSEDKCPICDCTKDNPKTLTADMEKVFEYNFGIKFIENSFVVNPACHDCGVTEVIDPTKFKVKTAHIAAMLPLMIKKASEDKLILTCEGGGQLHFDDPTQVEMIQAALRIALAASLAMDKLGDQVKLAGQKEVEDLNTALNLLVSVSQAMLKQKDQIDLEFCSDLIQVLADLQSVTDELIQQGYSRLPSPPEGQQEPGKPAAAPGAPAGAPTAPQSPQTAPVAPVAPGGKVSAGPAGEVGTVTSPTAARRINLEKFAITTDRCRIFVMPELVLGKSSKSIDNSFKIEKKQASKTIDIPFLMAR